MSVFSLTLENDADIIREYTETGSNKAATAFVRKYQKFVYATALRYLKEHEDAEDVAQEVFIKALSNLHKFRGDSSISTWLYRITINVSTNMIRKNKLKKLFSKERVDDIEDLMPETSTPEAIMIENELEKKFIRALSKLPEKQRETFALRYFDKLSYDEISNMLGTSVGGLKANYFQAVQKLARILQ